MSVSKELSYIFHMSSCILMFVTVMLIGPEIFVSETSNLQISAPLDCCIAHG